MPSPLVGLATVALVYRAWSGKSLTPAGLFVAAATAVVHALHPWSVFFWLLAAFFLAGNAVTKVKHDVKSTYTTSSTGGTAAAHPMPRTASQVLCNSLPASILIALHSYYLYTSAADANSTCLASPAQPPSRVSFFSSFFTPKPPPSAAVFAALPYGIIASYASAAADTFSSELGILSSTPPFLITDILGLLTFSPKRVPRGTNGGVTIAGIAAGIAGGTLISLVTLATIPFCTATDGTGWKEEDKLIFGAVIAGWGGLGSIVDSVLGGWLQASVVDARTGKVVEGQGGVKVLFDKAVSKRSSDQTHGRRLVSGADILSNNGVNLLMVSIMAAGAVAAARAVAVAAAATS